MPWWKQRDRSTRVNPRESGRAPPETAPPETRQAPRPDFARSEQPIMGDGQLGGAQGRGPEAENPEGSAGLSRGTYREQDDRSPE